MSERLLLIFMIDALGFEEAGEPARFLPELDRPRAPVRSVLGYSSAAIPTIMSGRLPAHHGQFSMYRRAGGDGVFRGLAPAIRLAARLTDRRWTLARWITRWLRFRGVTGYFSLYEIPLRLLPEFDLCQRRDLYAQGAFSGFPGLTDLCARVDGHRIWNWSVPEERALGELAAEIEAARCRVLFFYTAGLDAIMHAAGPGSEAARTALRRYGETIASLREAARRRYREVRTFVFGDHGMAPVTRVVDLSGPLDRLGLRVPGDALWFLDSTMARFWFRSAGDAARVEEVCRRVGGGRWLPPEELERLGAWFPGGDYGERIYLLDEGTIFVPSFMGRAAVRGMHGYHPDDPHSFTTLLTDARDGPYPRDLLELHDRLRSEITEVAR